MDGHPNFDKSEWKYYLDEAEQTPEVAENLAKLRENATSLQPEAIHFIDPSMGSGHVLVYAFDVLMQIYLDCGYTVRDAAQCIVRKNLYGLDIDKRAYQLAYFAVMMKARQYDRRFFTRGIQPNLSHFQDLPKMEYSVLNEPLRSFVAQFENADTYSSLLTVHADADLDVAVDAFEGMIGFDRSQMEHLMTLYRILSQKYDVVVTNPPYMGGSGMNATLSAFVKKHYPDSKSDLSTCFMEWCEQFMLDSGYYGMINIPVWMFLLSYEKLRKKILKNNTYNNMVHFGRGVFGSDFGTTAFIISKKKIPNYVAVYRRLFKKQGAVDSIEQKEAWFFDGMEYHTAQQENFSKIPGSPVAYWVGEAVLDTFNSNQLLGDIARPRVGQNTGDNKRFLRLWFEIEREKITFGLKHEELKTRSYKWIPYNKGGEYRRWYGNQEYLINWENDGKEIKDYAVVRNHGKHWLRYIQNVENMCKPGVTWSFITSGPFSVRFLPSGFICDVAGSAIFPDSKDILELLVICNSKFATLILQVVNPTINMQASNVASIPIIFDETQKPHIDALVEENIALSKADWNSFETSWDFKGCPLV